MLFYLLIIIVDEYINCIFRKSAVELFQLRFYNVGNMFEIEIVEMNVSIDEFIQIRGNNVQYIKCGLYRHRRRQIRVVKIKYATTL